MANSTTKRFRVAFSFAGEKREFVAHVASLLADRFGEEAILYDKYHESEFARHDLGIYLPDLYHDQSDLIIVVVCPDYDEKEWTGLEWTAIHALLKNRKVNEVMFFRFNRAKLRGLYDTTGYVELDNKSPAQAATLILERLAINEGNSKDHYTSGADGIRSPSTRRNPDPIPNPPDFYAEPPYIGSHRFVGRQAQLDTLSDWAAPADVHPVLLFEAIGGAGKSMLTWEWTTNHATKVRGDWAGRFWYSFYEKGAIMADFCQRTLVYMTGTPVEDFLNKKTPELAEQLFHELQARPWLLVLDGMERLLVAYHRFDFAQTVDEEADDPFDQIAHRDPCASIRPEDDDLIRSLAAAAPSKLLFTSRLTPRTMLNAASLPIPGVLRERLPGLRPPDAEALIRACGVRGDSQAIQNYLKSHCDCHPLVTGVLAGLINYYLPDRGNFDKWAADTEGGVQLNLANLNLVQKRNHILNTALAALPENSRQLLSTLALLSEAVDYDTLCAFNPHLPPEPVMVEEPANPENGTQWIRLSDDAKKKGLHEYQTSLERRRQFKQSLEARLHSPEYIQSKQKLEKTVRDLECRGLLQYDAHAKRYDLHPVVRGIAAGGLLQKEKEYFGQRVVDHFSQQAHSAYEQAETLEDVCDGLHVVRTFLQMGRHQQACMAYMDDLAFALHFNLEAHAETLSLLRPFFPQGWGTLPTGLRKRFQSYLASAAGESLSAFGELYESLVPLGAALLLDLRQSSWTNVQIGLRNISDSLSAQNRLATAERCRLLAFELAELSDKKQDVFCDRLSRFKHLVTSGKLIDAEAVWQLLDPMGRDWSREVYRLGDAEYFYAELRFRQENLKDEHLAHAEQLAKRGRNRSIIRALYSLRGIWYLQQGEPALASNSLHEAVRMAREIGKIHAAAETRLALAKFRLGQLPDPRREAEQLAMAKKPAHLSLANLWLAIGEREQAKKHALAAYRRAWADGEPYVHRYALNMARALLEELGGEIPNLPPYDPTKNEKFPWEDEVVAAIAKLRGEKETKKCEDETNTEV